MVLREDLARVALRSAGGWNGVLGTVGMDLKGMPYILIRKDLFYFYSTDLLSFLKSRNS